MNNTARLDEISSAQVLNFNSGEVKMFIHKSAQDAEVAVNQWLRHNNIKVSCITQSQSEKGGSFVFVFSVYFLRQPSNFH